uniref:Uncharacterized protein n=1 Tax=Otolemur garnettii TaxID=30611 RepID=H0XP96_OTOGA
YQEMMEEPWTDKTVPKLAIQTVGKRPQSAKTEGAKKWDYLVSKRELSHIERHIHRAERARGLRDHKYRPLPQKISSEKLSPKTLTLEKDEKNENIQKTHKTETKKHKESWAKKQMKGHQDRMIRGRELSEKRNDRRAPQRLSGQVLPFLKSQEEREAVKELEWVTAYPIFQPYQETLIEVAILTEKSKGEEEIGKLLKPKSRKSQVLRMPPFLRSQLKHNKDL